MKRLLPLLLALVVVLAPAASARHEALIHQHGKLEAHGIALTARSAILIDARTGEVLWGKRIHTRRQVASTTKIMTAIVAMERLRPHDVVKVDKSVRRVPPITEAAPGRKVRRGSSSTGRFSTRGTTPRLRSRSAPVARARTSSH